MFKTGGMGNVTDYNYAAEMTPEFKEMIDRMRYDVELTKAEMFRDRFTIPYTEWCKKLGVLSRAQAYGRGFFPLESGMYYDIPRGRVVDDQLAPAPHRRRDAQRQYRAGRAYTMINKYITSAAHLTGKRLISAEEMTNTYRVFNATPEFLKIGCDQNAQVGVTHSVWHGFNYSPAETEVPPAGCATGSFYNEKNNWWPLFQLPEHVPRTRFVPVAERRHVRRHRDPDAGGRHVDDHGHAERTVPSRRSTARTRPSSGRR